jgi:hypothetical protein
MPYLKNKVKSKRTWGMAQGVQCKKVNETPPQQQQQNAQYGGMGLSYQACRRHK